jgi:hypothetical protein
MVQVMARPCWTREVNRPEKKNVEENGNEGLKRKRRRIRLCGRGGAL